MSIGESIKVKRLATAELTTQESIELEHAEAAIRDGLQTFAEVGAALIAIRDNRLYRERHRTFEEYCSERWGMARGHAYRLIDVAGVMQDLSPIGDTGDLSPKGDTSTDRLPANEAQARPLASLDSPEERRDAWAMAVETAPEGKVTAAHIERVVKATKAKASGEAAKPSMADASKIIPSEVLEARRLKDKADRLAHDAAHLKDVALKLAIRFNGETRQDIVDLLAQIAHSVSATLLGAVEDIRGESAEAN